MQLLILSEYFLKIMVRVGLHIMIPLVVQAFCIIISVKLKVISSWYLNSHRIRTQTLILDWSQTQTIGLFSNWFQDNNCLHFLFENLRLTSGCSHWPHLKDGAKYKTRNITARDEYCMDLFLSITERTITIWNIASSLTFWVLLCTW